MCKQKGKFREKKGKKGKKREKAGKNGKTKHFAGNFCYASGMFKFRAGPSIIFVACVAVFSVSRCGLAAASVEEKDAPSGSDVVLEGSTAVETGSDIKNGTPESKQKPGQDQKSPPDAAASTARGALPVLGGKLTQKVRVEGNDTQNSHKKESAPAPYQGTGPGAEPGSPKTPQELTDESLRLLLPLDDGQINDLRRRGDQRDRAVSPVAPALSTRTVRVSLEPGQKPVTVRTTANVATSIIFHDSTGRPWPISSVTNGGAAYFSVLRPEVAEGNMVNVIPTQNYASTSLVVSLKGRDVPLVLRLVSDGVRAPESEADGLVLVQIAHHGPSAQIPIVHNVAETVSSDMLAFLDQVPPKSAERLSFDQITLTSQLWHFKDAHFLRTSDALIWPAWRAVVNGAGGIKCYEMPVTPRIMLSRTGKVITLKIVSKK
jgi:intracellular multiplication protein IcmK